MKTKTRWLLCELFSNFSFLARQHNWAFIINKNLLCPLPIDTHKYIHCFEGSKRSKDEALNNNQMMVVSHQKKWT